jgi:hypothetical protein
MDLIRSVLANELHLALVTAPPTDAKLTAAPFAETRLCAAHGVINAEQAFYLVFERAGVAILPRPSTLGTPAGAVVVRPLSDPAFRDLSHYAPRR